MTADRSLRASPDIIPLPHVMERAVRDEQKETVGVHRFNGGEGPAVIQCLFGDCPATRVFGVYNRIHASYAKLKE